MLEEILFQWSGATWHERATADILFQTQKFYSSSRNFISVVQHGMREQQQIFYSKRRNFIPVTEIFVPIEENVFLELSLSLSLIQAHVRTNV